MNKSILHIFARMNRQILIYFVPFYALRCAGPNNVKQSVTFAGFVINNLEASILLVVLIECRLGIRIRDTVL